MVEYDMRKIRRLRREIDDAKREARIVRLFIGLVVFILIGLLSTGIVGGLIYHNGGVGATGLSGTVLIVMLTAICCGAYFGDNKKRPFQTVRNAERKLEDYYDEVGTP